MSTLLYGASNLAIVLEKSKDSGSMAESLKIASLNTLVGLTVVFAVLTIIIFFISLFKVIPYLQNKSKADVSSVDNALAQIVEQEEELVNDGELVAVITAAICASMGDAAPSDGLVVRSIKRVNSNRWKNA